MDIYEKAFQYMKKIISREVMLAYPDFNKTFIIFTNTSTCQLRLVII